MAECENSKVCDIENANESGTDRGCEIGNIDKSETDKVCETGNIDNTLDDVLVTALRENFEIKNGYHVDRNEMLEFLRSVIKDHPKLNFVLQHRDTKLSGRIYKAFPRVTTKRVAVPSLRGKKIWTYTNLRQTTKKTDTPPSDNVDQVEATKGGKNEPEDTSNKATSIVRSTKRERKFLKSRRGVRSASMVHREPLFETYKRESSPKSNRNAGSVPQLQSYLARFSDMLMWIRDHYVLDKNSSIQVKHIVEGIKAEFKINITYKQSHKLIFAIFPGSTSRVAEPVKIEAHGGYYSYRGIAPRQQKKHEGPEAVIASNLDSSPPISSSKKFNSGCKTGVPPAEHGQKRVMRTRRRFIEACAVLKPAEEAHLSPINYDVSPISPEVSPRYSDVSPRRSDKVYSEVSQVEPRFSYLSPRTSEVRRRFSDVSPNISEMAAIERENNWRRIVEEIKQERDQAIVERNQAMVSLMEVDQEQTTPKVSDASQIQSTCADVVPSITRLPKIEERGNPDWLRSLIDRSNSILGEQMSESNAYYFPGSTLQSCRRFLSETRRYSGEGRAYSGEGRRYSGEYLDLERYEQLKQERDAIWKNWMEKLRIEKDDVIQQLKLDKMEIIQRMELEKSDAIECVEEKLTNQITILTREMRELKELLNHTMNERTLAIEHAHKLMNLVGVEKLKDTGLDSFPFDVTSDHVVHPPKHIKQKTTDEILNIKTACFGKGNKRKQSMPAKVKKIPRVDVSSGSGKIDGENESETVSTKSKLHLFIGHVSTDAAIAADDDTSAHDAAAGQVTSAQSEFAVANDTSTHNGVATGKETAVKNETSAAHDIAPAVDETVAENEVAAGNTTATQTDGSAADEETMAHHTVTADYNNTAAAAGQGASANNMLAAKAGASDNSAVTASPTNVQALFACDSAHKELDKTSRETQASCSSQLTNSRTPPPEYQMSKGPTQEAVNASEKQTMSDTNGSLLSSHSCSTDISSTNSNLEISQEFASSISMQIGDQATDSKIMHSKNESENSENGQSDFSSNSDKISSDLPGMILTSVSSTPERRLSSENSSITLSPLTKMSATNSTGILEKYSGISKSDNSGKYVLPVNVSMTSNFEKKASKSVVTEAEKFFPGIPRTLSVSESLARENGKNFEKSVNPTFLKYFPELPKSSFNSPLTNESSKYFRSFPRTVGSESVKYISNHDENIDEVEVSSIDFLNSMVESIGKSSVG